MLWFAAAKPGAPSQPSLTLGDRSVSVSWSFAASDSNGDPVHTFFVELLPLHVVMAVPGNAAYLAEFTGLAVGQVFTARVNATNTVGSGPWSAMSAQDTIGEPIFSGLPSFWAALTHYCVALLAGVPEMPTNVVANFGDATVTVTWDVPASNGKPITKYTVTTTPDIGSADAAAPTFTRFVTNGVDVQFSVSATNDIGVSAPSALTAVGHACESAVLEFDESSI